MKRLSLATLTAAACLVLSSGCSSVSVSSQGTDTVIIQNSGLFLFSIVPICSGDPDYPNRSVCNWFDNTVKLETNVRLLNEEIEKRGARGARNIVSHKDDDIYYFLILKRKIYRTSAELIR